MDEQTDEFSSGKSRGWSLSFIWFFALRLASSGFLLCDERTDGRTGFLQERAEVGAFPSSGFLLCAWVPNKTLGLFWFFALRLGTKQNIGFVLVFCFALGYQTKHWVCCGRARAIE